MKKFIMLTLIALAFAVIPIAAGPPVQGDILALSAVQAVTVNYILPASIITDEVKAIPIEAVYSLRLSANTRRGTARTPGDKTRTPGEDAPALDTKSKNYVPEGETRRFECTTTCYWDQTRYLDADALGRASSGGKGDVVEFVGPTEIPANFQFSNWREF